MLDRDAASGSTGGPANRVGLLLVAIVLGSLMPVGASAYLASRDSLPPSCHAGKPTASTTAGVIVVTDRASISLVEGDPGHPRKVVDYTPASPSPSPNPSPNTSPSGAPSPSSSPTSSPSPSPVAAPSTVLPAATLSADHRTLAFVVTDPPDAPGKVGVRVIDPTLPPPVLGYEAWNGPKAGASGRSEIMILPNGNILFFVPQHFDPPEKSTRLVGVVVPSANPKLAQSAPEQQFRASLHATWPETMDYQLPDERPQLQDRVLGPGAVVAGRLDRQFKSPLVDRTVHEIVTGRLGQPATTTLCAVPDQLTPAAFSPDGNTLALEDGTTSYLLDPSGGLATVFLLRGRVLDWRG